MPLKGLRVLIEAYAKLLPSHPNLELVVIGKLRKGPTAELLADLGLSDRVKFISDLSNEEMAEQYARATVCVTPSLYEGFGLPAAEAMSCGATVVVTDGGALPEVVGEAGVVVPKGDSAAMAAAIGALLRRSGSALGPGRGGPTAGAQDLLLGPGGASLEAVLRGAIARRC